MVGRCLGYWLEAGLRSGDVLHVLLQKTKGSVLCLRLRSVYALWLLVFGRRQSFTEHAPLSPGG